MQVLKLDYIYYYMVFLHLAATIKENGMRKSLEPPLESLETPIIYCYYNKCLVFQLKTAAVIRVHHVPEVRMDFSPFWDFIERLQTHILVRRHW